ncbi:MAG TPA: hypothetical protein PLV13_12415 [Ilumatobacteraceae bacterium]|nr:hypothetical protein [Ilumatobacteraceae bacterium]
MVTDGETMSVRWPLPTVRADSLTPPVELWRKAAGEFALAMLAVVVGTAAGLRRAQVFGRLSFSIASGIVVYVGFVVWLILLSRGRRGEESICRLAGLPRDLARGPRYAMYSAALPMASWALAGRLIRVADGSLRLRYGDHVYLLDELDLDPTLLVTAKGTIVGVRFTDAAGRVIDVAAFGRPGVKALVSEGRAE